MTKRKFYKRIVTLEFLSEEPFPPQADIDHMVFEARCGGYSMREIDGKDTELNGKQTAKALILQDSDPSFFRLDDKGNDIE